MFQVTTTVYFVSKLQNRERTITQNRAILWYPPRGGADFGMHEMQPLSANGK